MHQNATSSLLRNVHASQFSRPHEGYTLRFIQRGRRASVEFPNAPPATIS